jgi:hypothetical protein
MMILTPISMTNKRETKLECLENEAQVKQDRQCTHNVTMRGFHETITAVEKQ